MIGNSSSGIIEAASFRLPVVNVGHRQAGRVRGKNVIDAEIELDAMKQALSTALSYQFSENLQEMTNPYGNGNASESIQQTLESLPTREQLIHKVFTDR
jgi:UDP-N-acetylglucosamine 2-epimerase